MTGRPNDRTPCAHGSDKNAQFVLDGFPNSCFFSQNAPPALSSKRVDAINFKDHCMGFEMNQVSNGRTLLSVHQTKKTLAKDKEIKFMILFPAGLGGGRGRAFL